MYTWNTVCRCQEGWYFLERIFQRETSQVTISQVATFQMWYTWNTVCRCQEGYPCVPETMYVGARKDIHVYLEYCPQLLGRISMYSWNTVCRNQEVYLYLESRLQELIGRISMYYWNTVCRNQEGYLYLDSRLQELGRICIPKITPA